LNFESENIKLLENKSNPKFLGSMKVCAPDGRMNSGLCRP